MSLWSLLTALVLALLRSGPEGAGGTLTTNGDGGDIGLHIDPNG